MCIRDRADNQIRFQDLENSFSSGDDIKKTTKKTGDGGDKILPGSSQPQDLGSISYKDTATQKTNQQTQSIERYEFDNSYFKYIERFNLDYVKSTQIVIETQQLVIEIDDVLEAIKASFDKFGTNVSKILRLIPSFSVAASITKSATLKSL